MISKIKTIIRGVLGVFENLEKIEESGAPAEELTKSAGGDSIEMFQLGSGAKKILFLGCTHGNEVGTAKLVKKLINYLDDNKECLGGITAYFIPVLNADGYKKAIQNPDYFGGGRVGRTNDNNVDLNRNFDTKDWIGEGVWELGSKKIKVSGGEKPFSEPETKALVKFIEDNDINVIFDFHNRAGTVLATNDDLGKRIANIYCEISGYINISENTYQNTGWIKNYFEDRNVTYIEVETTKRWGSDWIRNEKAILEVLKYIANPL